MNQTTLDAAGLDPVELRDQLFEPWGRKDLQTLHVLAQCGFSKLSEPLEDMLTILEGCPGKQKGRSNLLGHHILGEFQKWMKANPQVTLSSLSEQQIVSLRHRALCLLVDTQPSYVDGLVNIYQLDYLDPDKLRLHIIRLQALNCYKEAAALSIRLKIQKELDMEEMCIPLILQNKLASAESFVTGHKDLEQQLVTLLDSWCHPNFSVEPVLKRFPRLSLSKQSVSHIQAKLLTKHVFRLMDKFEIDPGLCPRALHKRRLDTLRYLMYKTFVEKGMTEDNWSDHVQYVVADDPELQIVLVEMLVKYCGLQKASQWSIKYSVPRHRLPCGLWEKQQSLSPELQQVHLTNSAQAEEWIPSQTHCESFYQVPLPKEKVHFVDTQDTLKTCRNIVLKEGVVGIDMEWQPTFGCNSTQRVALIQIAVYDQCFLLDLCANGFCHHPDTISFIRSLFSEKNVLKLAYGMSGDIKCLLATWQQFKEEPLKMEAMLDLLNIHKKIQRSKFRLPQDGPKEVLVGGDSAEKGLSLLVRQVLGKPLDKTEQMSNWEKRPLRISQIRYAVADACCLLEVYSVLSSNPSQFGLPADLRSDSLIQPDQSRDKKQKEKQTKQTKQECQGAQRVSPSQSEAEKGLLCGEMPQEPQDGPLLPPQQLRVVCDNMLQGLGRYLRCLGVDVVMLENNDDHREAAKLAQAEGRVILTCGQPFQTLRSQVGEGRCLSLDCSEKAKDQAVRVLRHFNVQPTPGDIFSRCQSCNSDEYVAVPRNDMVRMLRQKGFLQDQDDDDYTHQAEEAISDFLPRYAPQCNWAPLSGLDPDTLTFPGGAPIQLHTVPPGLLPKIPHFYVCTRCGKVFWEGSHFSRVLSMFQDVLQITDEDGNSAAELVAAAQ